MTSAVPGKGTHCLVIDSASSDAVDYSLEATGRIDVAPDAGAVTRSIGR